MFYPILSSVFWIYILLSNYKKHKSNIHAIPVVILSLLSIFSFIDEWYVIYFSFSYFIWDLLLHCIPNKKLQYIIHHVFTISVFFSNIMYENQKYKFTSYTLLIELTTPILNLWKKNNKKWFNLLFVSFFCVRIFYYSCIFYYILCYANKYISKCISGLIFFLQYIYFYKLCKIKLR